MSLAASCAYIFFFCKSQPARRGLQVLLSANLYEAGARECKFAQHCVCQLPPNNVFYFRANCFPPSERKVQTFCESCAFLLLFCPSGNVLQSGNLLLGRTDKARDSISCVTCRHARSHHLPSCILRGWSQIFIISCLLHEDLRCTRHKH